MKDCKDCVAVLRAGIKGLCRVHELEAENRKLRTALQEAIDCIGDGDNGPAPFYADLFARLEAALACDDNAGGPDAKGK